MLAFATLAVASDRGATAPCPPAGAQLEVRLRPPEDLPARAAIVFGALVEPSCAENDAVLALAYASRVTCDPLAPSTCSVQFEGLRPGRWTHRLLTQGVAELRAQIQGRASLLLDASAGGHVVEWPLFRSVVTVTSLEDGNACSGCLRAALGRAEMGPKPALVQFAPDLAGAIVLSEALPALATGEVTIDAFDTDGQPHSRTLDGNGLNAPALTIRSAHNAILGLRITNVGGNSDAVLISGAGADDNLLESVQIVGRSLDTCGTAREGCRIEGVCRTRETDPPSGACGDDGVAIRLGAGVGGANLVRACEVSGAFDKAVKVSDGAVGRVERSHIHHNRDGGLQATLGGALTAVENLIEANRGTNSASGLAANGPAARSTIAARLETRGNISRDNALRGLSIRSLSEAVLQHDYACGNGTAGRQTGFGLAIFDGAGMPAIASVTGTAAVHNTDGGALIAGDSWGNFGSDGALGHNAFAFNGAAGATTPTNFLNLTPQSIPAANNHWEHCGRDWRCNETAVRQGDLLIRDRAGEVTIGPAQPVRRNAPPTITTIEPPFAAAGELVRVYGSGFDAIDGNAASLGCAAIADQNRCAPLRGNCVRLDRQPARVVAVTPTMLVVEAPFTCVAPVAVAVRTARARGYGRARFCVLPAAP